MKVKWGDIGCMRRRGGGAGRGRGEVGLEGEGGGEGSRAEKKGMRGVVLSDWS